MRGMLSECMEEEEVWWKMCKIPTYHHITLYMIIIPKIIKNFHNRNNFTSSGCRWGVTMKKKNERKSKQRLCHNAAAHKHYEKRWKLFHFATIFSLCLFIMRQNLTQKSVSCRSIQSSIRSNDIVLASEKKSPF